jgi:tetratricopeptide (TPR) repeat protein
LGKQALDAGNEATALTHFLRASDGPVSGASVSAALAAANLHELRDRPDQAKAIFVRMVALAPGVPELRFAAARFFAGQRDTERAIEGFRATIRHQPEFLPAYPLLAALWMQAGKQDDATQLLLTYESKLNTQLRRLRDVQSARADKVSVIDLLALIEDERATEGIMRALKDQAPEVRIAAAGALGDDSSAEALTALVEALKAETDPIARQVLIAATRRARDAARKSLEAPSPTMPAPRSGSPVSR